MRPAGGRLPAVCRTTKSAGASVCDPPLKRKELTCALARLRTNERAPEPTQPPIPEHMSPSKPSRLQLLLTVIVCCSSTANAIEAFPDSNSRSSVVGQVVAPHVGDITTASFTAATITTAAAAKPNLRSGSTNADAANGLVLPGGSNGFGQVSYNRNAPEARSASDSSSSSPTAPVETQAEYRARIRKAEKKAEAKYPYLRMQNLVAF